MKQRKNQHIEYALQFHQTENRDWDQVVLPISSLPELDFKEISLKTDLMGFDLEVPFYINAMTGGSKRAFELNRQLAIVARECNLMLAMGSYSIVLRLPEARESFDIIRKEAPDICLGVNLGADKTAADAVRAISESGADFLQIHVNPLQEILMPEGERDFRGWLKNISEMVSVSTVPVMVKQVGFGMSRQDIERLLAIGVKTIDVSGRGGTNFARIENARSERPQTALEELGYTTVESLNHVRPFMNRADFAASGGIKNSLHIAKALYMGARAVGISGQILHLLERYGLERTIEQVELWKTELQSILLVCGAKNIEALHSMSENEKF